MPFGLSSVPPLQETPAAESRPAPKREGLPWWAKATLVGANGFDMATTAAALRNPRLQESNPLLPQNPWAIGGIKAGSTAGQLILLEKFAEKHKRAAIIAALVAGAIPAIAGVRNLKTMREAR